MRRVTFATFAFVLGACAAQPPPRLSREDAARQLMTRARYCALITLGEDGQPQARTIDPAPPDAKFVVRFVTNPRTRKVAQIQRDSRVTLYYSDASAPGYVTLIGTARAIEAPEQRQRSWVEKWTPFYPGGAASAALYEVTPLRIEVVDSKHGVSGDQQTWRPPVIEMQ